MTDLPEGYRWANPSEMNRPDAIVVKRTADENGVPYTQDEADLAVPLSTDVEDAREGLAPLHRLLLDLGHFVSRYETLSNVIDPDERNSVQEEVASIFEAFGECAGEIEKIAQRYLLPDGGAPINPVVLVEVEDGVTEVSTYHYPMGEVVIDWDDVSVDGEYTAERKADVQLSTLPEEVKRDLCDRLNSHFRPY